ncbi:ABC transporter ATP-binding protein [Pikeienuella sp. HZG-20]|uniref:ABC transporter ATP-binding protein n=1 Tax=Paludibacillus litoralis TaxID=3133267 RepID=UPI0030ED0505
MTSDARAIVEFKNVDKSYDGVSYAVRDLDLVLREGEFITLLGPSGSGKTTTLMMLAGFEQPTSGDILYEGRGLASIPAHKRNFGMVFQNYALFPHMSVAQNVAFPLSIRRVGKAEAAEKARAALDMVHLAHLADRRPAQLSGGQQQRVALARALVFSPRVVLMDEPLGALDKKLREEMQIELKHLHEDLGMTFVFVTHDQDEALTMSDRIAVFDEGRIQQVSDPAGLYETPENAFVASFLGDTNMLRGKVCGVHAGVVEIELGDGSRIHAADRGRLAPGAEALVSIRPERIGLGVDPSDLSGASGVNARKVETIYRGAHASVLFRSDAGETITVRMPADAFESAEIGDADVKLNFSHSHAHAFPAAPTGAQEAG